MNATRKCLITGCDRPGPLKRGWCNTHYQRWRKHGDPLGGGRSYPNPEESFAARTKWQGNCLIWTGAADRYGYGRISVAGTLSLTHRYAWERENGPIPEGADIDHICHNPACVNVEHLRTATRSQNMGNRAGHNTNSTSKARNVYWHEQIKKWVVGIKRDGKFRTFGAYPTVAEAAVVAEQKRKELFGEYAGKG